MVLLPKPEGPTIAVDSPAGIVKDRSLKVNFYSFGTVGYLNDTFEKFIDYISSKPII